MWSNSLVYFASVCCLVRSEYAYFEAVLRLENQTFSGSAALDASNNHRGSFSAGSSQFCAAACLKAGSDPQTPGSCKAFSFCRVDRTCDLLVGVVLDDNLIASTAFPSKVECGIFNRTQPLVSTGSDLMTTTTSVPTSAAMATTMIVQTSATMPTTTVVTTTPSTQTTTPPDGKTATISNGTLSIPIMNLTTYPDTVALCRSRYRRAVDIADANVQTEICNALKQQMQLGNGASVWIHADINENCGNPDQAWQLTVGTPSCTFQIYSRTQSFAYPFCFQRSADTLSFTRNNSNNTAFNFRINLAYMMSYDDAVAWCATQTGPRGALSLAKYNNLEWYASLKSFFNADRDTFSCDMEFWVRPMTMNQPTCQHLSYIMIDQNVNAGNFNEKPDMNATCTSSYRFALCSDNAV